MKTQCPSPTEPQSLGRAWEDAAWLIKAHDSFLSPRGPATLVSLQGKGADRRGQTCGLGHILYARRQARHGHTVSSQPRG